MTSLLDRSEQERESVDSRSPASVDSGGTARASRGRLALGLAPTPQSGLFLVLLGVVLGPRGLSVLTDTVLTTIDPAVTVALAALGVYAALDLKLRGLREGRVLALASVEAAVTAGVVGLGLGLVHIGGPVGAGMPWLMMLFAAICAAPSASPIVDSPTLRQSVTLRIGELDDVLPLVGAGLLIAWLREGSAVEFGSVVVQASAIAIAIAFAARLLITATVSESEQRVFVIGALLLLGGAAAHLSLSALAAGLVAGILWNLCGGAAADHIGRDMRYLQPTCVVLLLVVAGARLSMSSESAALAIGYAILRLGGKLAAARTLRRFAPDLSPDAGLALAGPGLAGLAIALDVAQTRGTQAAAEMFAVVVLGSLGSAVLARAMWRLGGAR
jgi:hypothetical protein